MKKVTYIFNIALVTVLMACTAASTYAKTINFAIASDVHYSSITETENRKFTNGAKALNGLIDRINENKYDYVVFLGDNIDKSNKKNLVAFLNTVKKIKTPYYLVPGNHDTHKISGLTKEEYAKIVHEYNKTQKKEATSYYFYPSADIIAIVLDNVSSGMPSTHGMYNDKTLKFLDETLSKNKNKKAIIFQHVPFVEPYESPSHNILEKDEFNAVIRRHDNILAICSGHYHREFVKKDDRGIYHISAPALYEAPYYYYELQIKYDKKPFLKPQNVKIDGTAKPAI